jgi:catechol 2,3-dioxygenase-like lactoylglutathione lyase family enzyme
MEGFVAQKLNEFENGKLSRRRLIEQLTLAATSLYAADSATAQADQTLKAQAPRGFKVLGVNHISYTCPDYTRARDFQINVFGLENAAGMDKGNRANLMFGPEPGKGGSFIVARNPSPTPSNKPPAQAYIDHYCYTLSNWDEARVRAAIKAKGQEISGGRDGSLHVLDPFNYDIQFANIVEENAFRR